MQRVLRGERHLSRNRLWLQRVRLHRPVPKRVVGTHSEGRRVMACEHCTAPPDNEGMPNADLDAQQLMAELGPASETIDTWPAWKQALVASRSEKQMEDGR